MTYKKIGDCIKEYNYIYSDYDVDIISLVFGTPIKASVKWLENISKPHELLYDDYCNGNIKELIRNEKVNQYSEKAPITNYPPLSANLPNSIY